MQRVASSGNTTAFRVKALLLHVQAAHGRVVADAFLRETGLDRELLEDETRPLGIELWHRALVVITSKFGRDEVGRSVKSFVDAENLGAWTRVLRGAGDPGTAYRQLGLHGGDEVLTERWQTQDQSDGYWRGTAPLLHDPAHERDGLCALARAAELRSVPLLYGLAPAEVRQLAVDPEFSGGAVLVFEARFAEGPSLQPSALVGAGLGGAAAVSLWAAGLGPTVSALGGFGGAVLGAGGGFVAAAERRRRAAAHSQLVRITALERDATLRDSRARGSETVRPGAVIAGQYRLGETLGAGGSGAIWEAQRLGDGRVVAIKVLRAAMAHDTVAADRLRREAEALGLAWHPNVVEVYDDGHLPDGTSYMVMERLHGESLAARLKRTGPLTTRDLGRIALQVCDALSAVHAAGVIHRDVKPSNIFLTRDANGADTTEGAAGIERVKLLDFGVARVEWAETRITNYGAPLGTPGYMSPEQEEGDETDARSDLFSLGAVLYECLTGVPPPIRSSALWERPEPGADRNPSGVQRMLQAIPTSWRRVIETSMAPIALGRYRDAKRFREALAEVMEAEGHSSRISIA